MAAVLGLPVLLVIGIALVIILVALPIIFIFLNPWAGVAILLGGGALLLLAKDKGLRKKIGLH